MTWCRRGDGANQHRPFGVSGSYLKAYSETGRLGNDRTLEMALLVEKTSSGREYNDASRFRKIKIV